MSAPIVSKAKHPAVDSRLVAPGSQFEIEDGRVQEVVPADEPHATRQAQLSALLEAHVVDGYQVASDMLTRTSEVDDIAPDASVFPRARNPETGGRQLEELAFEIASTQSMSDVARKARKLAARGVRRIFAIDIPLESAYEWSEGLDAWRPLELDSPIVDATLAFPLPVELLVRAAKVDDAVARALLAKGNRVLESALAKSRDDGKVEGKVEGKIDALFAVLAAKRLELDGSARERIRRERDEDVIDGWLGRAATATQLDEIFEASPPRA